jgi:hypothetical protein
VRRLPSRTLATPCAGKRCQHFISSSSTSIPWWPSSDLTSRSSTYPSPRPIAPLPTPTNWGKGTGRGCRAWPCSREAKQDIHLVALEHLVPYGKRRWDLLGRLDLLP